MPESPPHRTLLENGVMSEWSTIRPGPRKPGRRSAQGEPDHSLPCACGMSSASAYGYVCTQDLEVRWHIRAFALLRGNEYLEVLCDSNQLHFALLVLVYPDSTLLHCGSVACAKPNNIDIRGRSQPRRIGKMPYFNIELRVFVVLIFLDSYNPGRCRSAAASSHRVFLRTSPRPYGKQDRKSVVGG